MIVRFDARARGKSDTSADYSAHAAVDDIGRVIEATGIERPILVGWSYGATIAVGYAAHRSAQLGGLVLIDGAYPIAVLDEAGKEKSARSSAAWAGSSAPSPRSDARRGCLPPNPRTS